MQDIYLIMMDVFLAKNMENNKIYNTTSSVPAVNRKSVVSPTNRDLLEEERKSSVVVRNKDE